MSWKSDNKTVHYLSYYIDQEYIDYLDGSMAVLPKVEYICDALKNGNCKIKMISTANAKRGVGWFSKKKSILSKKVSLLTFSSYGAKTKIGRLLSRIWIKLQLLIYLLKNVKDGDCLLIYHSLQYIKIISLFRLIRRNKVILQVEEIYSDAYKKFRKYKSKEINYLLKADSYICINETVREIIAKDKPATVLYGDYRIPSKIKSKVKKSNKIHVVYSGVIEPSRKAAVTAVNAARYLNENYLIHIAGFGNKEYIDNLIKLINEVNSELNYVGVQYDGSLHGEEFTKYLQEKDIGLNCHSYTKEDLISAEVTFPSKIIIYLINGLKVVSPEINCLVNSELKEFIQFYKGFEAKGLAQGILLASETRNNKEMVISKIRQFDKKFKSDIKIII